MEIHEQLVDPRTRRIYASLTREERLEIYDRAMETEGGVS